MASEWACARAWGLPWSKSKIANYSKYEPANLSRKWVGVRISNSFSSALVGTSGRALKLHSTRQKVVERNLSVKHRSPRTAWKVCLRLRTSRFLTTAWCGALDWLNIQFMRFFTSDSVNAYSFHLESVVKDFLFSCFEAGTVVRPDDSKESLATYLSIPITQLLVSIDVTTSKWTTRVVRQVKWKPDRFCVERLTET